MKNNFDYAHLSRDLKMLPDKMSTTKSRARTFNLITQTIRMRRRLLTPGPAYSE